MYICILHMYACVFIYGVVVFVLCKAIEMPSANKEGIISLMCRDFLSVACCNKTTQSKSEINVDC